MCVVEKVCVQPKTNLKVMATFGGNSELIKMLLLNIFFSSGILAGFAHHLVGMHSHLHAPDWRALSGAGGAHAAALGRSGFPHGNPFFHHQHPAFAAHNLAGSLDRTGLANLNGSLKFHIKIKNVY